MNAADGSLSPLNKFGFTTGTYNTDIAVNVYTGNFVMGWAGATPGGAGSSFAHFDRNGTLLNIGLITNRLGGNDNFSLAFNAVSGTLLAVGQDNLSYEVAAIELNSGGTPISTAGAVTQGGAQPGTFYPRATSRG